MFGFPGGFALADNAIAIRQNHAQFQVVAEYYAGAQAEIRSGADPIQVGQVVTFKNNFEDLVSMMIVYNHPHYVVVAHGDENMGLIMPINLETKVSAGYAMGKLATLIEKLDAADSGGPALDQDWLKNNVAKDWRLSVASVLRVANLVRQLRGMPYTGLTIEIRGCNIGKKQGVLEDLKKVLAPKSISAPICHMFYVPVVPNRLPAQQAPKAQGRRRTFTDGSAGSLLLDIVDAGQAKFNSYSYASDQKAVPQWAKKLIPGWSGGNNLRFVAAGMWPDQNSTYYLASDGGYANSLRVVKT